MKSTTIDRSALPALGIQRISTATSYILFIIAIFLVIPSFDVPLLGLSLTAPLFFLIAVQAVFKPPRPWSRLDRRYIALPILIWAGIFLSMVVNGLASGGIAIGSYGFATVVRYAYWLLVFVLTAYVVSAGKILDRLCSVLGWSVLALVILRWVEVFFYNNIGAWTGTHFLSENSYGYLFSTFSPLALGMIFSRRKTVGLLAMLGTVLLWGAAAINGSRGSWIGIVAGLFLFLAMLGLSQPRKAVGGLFVFLLIAGIAFVAFSASANISQAVVSRLETMQNLETEKSYVIRELMNQKAERLFEQSPLFGVGPGRFQDSYIALDIPQVLSYAGQEHFDAKSSHNSYLGFLAENGLFGAVPLGILLLVLMVVGFKAAISLSKQRQYWGIAIYCSFVGMSVHLWAISALTDTATWFIYGLVAAMIILSRPESEGENENRLSLSRTRPS